MSVIAAPKMTAHDLLDRLDRHYIKRGQPLPGGIFVPEVGLNGIAPQRRCDAIYIGFTSASGRLLIGHEIKVSRSDWLHELDQPEKSATWADQCHGFYVVAPSTDIVPIEELPHGWGLMIPDPRSKVRMKIVQKAKIKEQHHPSWLAVRSIMARLDTLQQTRLARWKRDEDERIRSEVADKVRERQLARDPQAAQDARVIDELNERLGVDLRAGSWQGGVDPATLAHAIKLVQATSGMRTRYNGLEQTARGARHLADELDQVSKLIGELDHG